MQYEPVVAPPAYGKGKGPRVGIDEGHHNFHTAEGRYKPFARLVERDGFRVVRVKGTITTESLRAVDILVIANPLNAINDGGKWLLPTPSAFTKEEIVAIHAFVEGGGALLLIADHMPFAGAATDLGDAFGIHFVNGFAQNTNGKSIFTLHRGSTLLAHATTDGRRSNERIDSLTVFTGSALGVIRGEPVMRLPPDVRVDTPDVAWQFTANTPFVPGDGLLFGAALEVAEGRVFAAGEAAMFSAQRSGPKGNGRMGFNVASAPQNAQFVLNVLHWLAKTP